MVLSPLVKSTHSKTVTFVMGNDYTLQEANKTVTEVMVKLTSGESYQNIPLNGTNTLTFANTGLHIIKFKITYQDNSIQYTYAKIKVNNNNPLYQEQQTRGINIENCAINVSIPFMSELTFQGYDEDVAYSGMGEYRIYRGGATVDKPVIVVDGFDPSEGSDDGTGLFDIYSFLEIKNSGHLGTILRTHEDGYDIIPLNFVTYQADDGTIIEGGTDYIERNAMVLIELINRINACKVGDEPIKLVGFSMGGLIARYALRYMELNNMTHGADLFISVDTPHKGATVPIGIQEMADFIDDATPFGLGDFADDILMKPATKQMLAHHFLANSYTPAGAPNFHDRFYNALNNMGFPEQTRNVAVCNGLTNGTPINDPNQKYVDGNLSTQFLLPVRARIKAKLKYAPNRGQTNEAFNFKLQLRFIGEIYITVYKRVRHNSTISAYGSYENSPGGYYDVESLASIFYKLEDDFSVLGAPIFRDFIIQAEAELTNPNFSFIPIKSSLAYSGINEDLYEDFSDRDLVCSGETPFDSYFTAIANNEEHIDLFYDSADYMKQEITGNPQSPNVGVTDQLLGPNLMCTNDINTFNFANCHGAPVQNWEVSTSLSVVVSDEHFITVESSTNTSSSAYVRALFADGSSLTKHLWLGKPNAPSSLSGPESVNSGSIVAYQGGEAEGATEYMWWLPYPYLVVTDMDYDGENWQMYAINTRSLSHVFTGYGEIEGNVQLMGVNDCGAGAAEMIYVTHDGCEGPGCGGSAIVNPDPVPNSANESFNLDFTSYPEGTYYIFIYDMYSNIMYEGQSNNIEKTVTTINIPNGIYYLHIHDGDEVATQQLVIEH